MGRPGRRQSPLDPDDGGGIAGFARQLRAAHDALPEPTTLTELAGRAGYSIPVISAACGGKKLPTWEVTEAFLEACHVEVDEKWWNSWLSCRTDAERESKKVPRLPAGPPFPMTEADTAATAGLDSADPDEDRRSRRLRQPIAGARKRRYLIVLLVLVVAIAVTITITKSSGQEAAATCEDIGVAYKSVDASRVNRAAWQRAYAAGGGRSVLGCPLPQRDQGLVHEWGPGLSQDLLDDQKRPTRLMSVDVDTVYVMTGILWTDYTRPDNNVAAGRLGYPVSEPIKCGNATVVVLDKGDLAPGAMVSTPTGRYVWLPRPLWLRYRELGGPTGPLGRPLNGLDRGKANNDLAGIIDFENDTTIELHSGATTVQAPPSTALIPPTPCPL